MRRRVRHQMRERRRGWTRSIAGCLFSFPNRRWSGLGRWGRQHNRRYGTQMRERKREWTRGSPGAHLRSWTRNCTQKRWRPLVCWRKPPWNRELIIISYMSSDTGNFWCFSRSYLTPLTIFCLGQQKIRNIKFVFEFYGVHLWLILALTLKTIPGIVIMLNLSKNLSYWTTSASPASD